MPYAANEDLPTALTRSLPAHAQDIYRAAFNAAWKTYANHPHEERETIAHKVAWAAVKQRYRKLAGIWQPIAR
jgi:cation transport regulator